MADADSIVARLERVSLGLDALERLGELAGATHQENVPTYCVGAPLGFLASELQELVCQVIVELKAGGAHG